MVKLAEDCIHVLSIILLAYLIFTQLRVLIRSKYTLLEFIGAILKSYRSFFTGVMCHYSSTVALRYYIKNWRYMLLSISLIFELYIASAYLIDLYNGFPRETHLLFLIGRCGLFLATALYINTVEKIIKK